MLHGLVSLGFELKTKSVYPTWPHTRACDLAVWQMSVFLTGLARPSTRVCIAIFRAHGHSYTG
ncbi:hypothetical protein F383_19176 [Gossypium arboreum]|uniref:Uncharacterized protein n=1 Tax=Gossypium arboreum TaxID=29729 RepID=A0A0B0MIE2_GOSAR|nr:hypothetical protein F383_19176 [Gossypium arboreum]